MVDQTLKARAMKAMHKLISASLLFLLLTACNSRVVYSEYKNFPENEWKLADKAVFEMELTDNVSFHDINLLVRHADSYPFRNLIVFVTVNYPDGASRTDTMDLLLANDKGEWLGAGAGDIYDLTVPVKKNLKLPLKGKYKFEFVHGMRPDPLPLIMDFGLSIEKSKQ